MLAKTFRDLRAYQAARAAAKEIFEITHSRKSDIRLPIRFGGHHDPSPRTSPKPGENGVTLRHLSAS
jgi:hypothetical protein